MALKRSRQFQKLWPFLLIGGLLGLTWYLWKKQPAQIIRRKFSAAGIPSNVIDYWIAIAKHETAGFTSRVFKEANNLFGMKFPRGVSTAIGALPYGENQAIFKSVEDSAADQVLYLTRRFNYPKNFASVEDLVKYMKSKGYFEADENEYLAGVKRFL